MRKLLLCLVLLGVSLGMNAQVEDITFEHIALNLPAIAKNALESLSPDQGGYQQPMDDVEVPVEPIDDPDNEE